MALNLSSFKPFEHSDYRFLADRLRAYKREYPRFYESLSRYTHQPHVFVWGEIEGHLCIVKKRQIMGNPVCYLMLPPIGPNPLPIIEMFAENKISTMLSEEDIQILGIHMDDVQIDKDNAEDCYRLDAFSDRYGVNKNQLRRACNQALRMQESSSLDIRVYSCAIPPDVVQMAVDLTNRWKGQRQKKSYKTTSFVESFNDISMQEPNYHLAVFLLIDDRCVGYLITEKTPNGIINNVACTDYEDNPMKDTTAVLLHTAASKWVERGLSGATVVNRGAAVRGSSSKIAKEKLRPIIAHQNYKLKVDRLSKEEYDALWIDEKCDLVWL